jgi:YfiR/HmsC-like
MRSQAFRLRRIGTRICVLMAGLVFVWIGRASCQEQMQRQEDIKATFLFNFAKFVEWPDSSSGDSAALFRIEIIGRDPFDGRFDQLMIGKSVNGQAIEVIHSLSAPSAERVRIAFVSASEGKRLDSLLNTYRQNGVLTVSDIANFTQRGGMIGFVTEPGAVRFRINLAAVDGSQLRVSSRLLALGR